MRPLSLLLLCFFLTPAVAQTIEDRNGVHDAVLDYVEGLYHVEPERIERSVSPDLVKFGWYQSEQGGDFRAAPMTFEQLVGLASRWNVDNRQNIDDSTPKEIVVFDVLDQTAAAKLTAHWGIDYFQLEKIDGRWMIRHVLWQSHPQGSDSGSEG